MLITTSCLKPEQWNWAPSTVSFVAESQRQSLTLITPQKSASRTFSGFRSGSENATVHQAVSG
jgi:hypothetical protein